MNIDGQGFPLSHASAEDGRAEDLYAPPSLRGEPLRIVLLVNAPEAMAWVARIVEQIQHSEFAKVVLVVRNGEQASESSLRARISNRLRHMLYLFYSRHDIARRRVPDSAFRMCELQPLLEGVDWISVNPKRRGYVHRLRPSDLERIRAASPDVLLRFGFNILRGDILGVARHGVWSYHHGDSAQYRGGPPMFWEIAESNPLTGTVLQQLNEQLDAGDVLYRSHAATHPHSQEINRNAAYWKASSFVMRCLRVLARDGAVPRISAGVYNKTLYRTPGNMAMAKFLGRIGLNKTRILIDDRLREQHWFVAWRHTTVPLDPEAPRLQGMRELPCPKGHFYADPMLYKHEGQPWLFVEDFDYRRAKGSLVAIPWSDEGPAGPAQQVLDLDVHLSYPFVFCWRGETYLVPESVAARRVSLFRARSFPDRWEFVCDLLHGHRAVDATLHEHEGRWYMFTSICEAGGGTCDELFLFHADTPLGPFRPHPGNPLVSDVRCARPAGRLFRHGGRLIRPAQDCSRGYGSAVAFREVLELDSSHYRERLLGQLTPTWAPGLSGCHTYSELDGIEIVDGKRPSLRRVIGAPRQGWT